LTGVLMNKHSCGNANK